jgi:methylase of polypeptide subunit release factors
LKTYIELSNTKRRKIPDKFQKEDNRFSENLVEYFLEHFTKKRDKVLDIFAGLGTTLFVAEEMERIPYGLEYNQERFQYIRKNLLKQENIIHGDSLRLSSYDFPKCDFSLSSPPFMMKESFENPFTNCKTMGGYKQYLADLKKIYSQLKMIMKPKSYIALEVANLKGEKGNTTLAWDIGKSIAEVLSFVGEIIIIWTDRESVTVDGHSESWRIAGTYGYGYDHSYCLIFQNK